MVCTPPTRGFGGEDSVVPGVIHDHRGGIPGYNVAGGTPQAVSPVTRVILNMGKW